MVSQLVLESIGQQFVRPVINQVMSRVMSLFVVGFLMTIGLCALWTPAAIADDYTKDVLIRVDMSGKDLTDSQFNHTNLRESNLSNTNLRAVNMFAANLEFVNLSGANLSFATLESARITDANLNNAVLEGAYTSNAKFDRTTIVGADFTDVDMRDDVRKDLCKVASGTNPTTMRATRETLYCDE
jgi:uncharacterized protein YjbI with pentapeptide repeats